MSGNQRKKKKRIWWIAGVCVLAVVLIAVGVGVGVRLAAPSGPAETAAGADPSPSTPEGLPRVEVSGAQGCLVDRVAATETLVEAYKKIQNPPEAAGAVELAGFMTAYLVTASQGRTSCITRTKPLRRHVHRTAVGLGRLGRVFAVPVDLAAVA